MNKIWHILTVLLLAVPVAAQNGYMRQTAAGKDFYFTLLNHWEWNTFQPGVADNRHVGISIYAVEAADITFSTPINSNGAPIYTWHIDAGWIFQSSFAYPDQLVLQGVNIHSTGDIYIDIWVNGGTSSDQSVILPKHLLGKSYVLQGIPGTTIVGEGAPTPTYSQFTVVGTENGTSVSVSPRVNMVCRSRSDTLINAGQVYTTSIQENEVLLFQPENYSHDISGTVVESDRAVAVFQGNNVTCYPSGIVTDYVWEQARPTDAWGKEFIVAGTGRLVEKAFAITALEDNTQVEFYIYSMRYKTVTLNRGETAWGGENISGYGGLGTEYIKSDKPVCCYMYTTSHSLNDGKGNPSMAEILPVDHMATEAHWGLIQTDDNGPYSNTLLVTTRDDNMDKVKFNGRLLSEYATQSGIETYSIYGYTTYEIPHTISGNLTTSGEGFSAYVMRVATRGSGAAAFNVSLPDPPPEELCTDGVLLFREDFGGNDVNDPVVSHTPVEGMSYTQIYALEPGPTGSMGAGRYLVSKEGYRNSTYSNYSVWHIMDDHTYPDDKTRGYMMEVDGKGGQAAFYRTTLTGLCAGSRMSFSAYIANLTTASQYNGWRNDRGYVHPKLLFVIRDIQTGEIIAQQGTDTISHDWNNYPKPWRESAEWQLVGMNFTIPDGTNDIELSIYNNANGEAAGNDFALDDIEIWQCTPKVQIVSPESVCEDAPYSFEIEIVNAHLFEGELSYKWMYRSPDNPNGWQEMAGGNVREPRIDAFKAQNAGWYKVYVAEEGKIDDPNERVESEEFYVSLMKCGDELCMDGVLLFREDFGGNEESDPVAGTDPVDGMSSGYTQIFDTAHCHGNWNCVGMSRGRYLLTKKGYRNAESYAWSHWYIMDDHTYPNDYNRGYLLEIDGKGGSDAFFKKRMDGLCPGSKLSFTAYIANVTTCASYLQNRHSYTYPKLSFIIKDPRDGSILARHNTDTIGHDWRFYNTSNDWRNSAEWQLVGMNFTIPDGTDDIELSIYNNANGEAAGNDFALDDIEIRLCAPPAAEVIAPDSVCINTKVSLRAEMENDGTFKEPLQYKWYFSADSLNWEPVNDGNGQELRLKAKPKHSGWYRVAVAGSGGIENENCRSMSEPFRLHVIEECPPILCPEGVLLQHEEVGGTVTNWSGEIADICANMDLSFIVNMPSPHDPTRLMIRITDSGSGNELRAYDTGDIPSDSLQVGTTFTVPEGVQGVQWSISQNGGNGDFPIENTEVRLCLEPIRVTGSSPACRKKRYVFRGVYDNYGILENPEFRWEFSADSATWTTVQEGAAMNYTIPVVHKSHEGWYRLSVAEAGNLDKPNCRETSEPFKLATQYCETAAEQHIDTIVCDTLLVSGYAWRGHVWNTTGEVIDTLKDIDQDDSLYVHKTLEKKVCCPDILNYRVDTAVCDTLLPFVWLWRDRMLMFEDIGEQEVEITHAKWENCVGEVYTLHLDTFHCERLYPIIVNKYNWLVLLDYKSLRRFFPDQTAVSFQWYRDSVAIEGGTGDDYSETQELHGHFQLRIQMNDGQYVWSNILDISDTPEPKAVHVRVYNSNGILLYEEDINDKPYTPVLPAGIYLLRYEQGEEVWTEKKVTL